MEPLDAAFLRDMIAHHRAGIALSQRYLARSAGTNRLTRVAALARDISAVQGGEITTMSDWLTQAGEHTTADAAHPAGLT